LAPKAPGGGDKRHFFVAVKWGKKSLVPIVVLIRHRLARQKQETIAQFSDPIEEIRLVTRVYKSQSVAELRVPKTIGEDNWGISVDENDLIFSGIGLEPEVCASIRFGPGTGLS
jgi:hypothetical protein